VHQNRYSLLSDLNLNSNGIGSRGCSEVWSSIGRLWSCSMSALINLHIHVHVVDVTLWSSALILKEWTTATRIHCSHSNTVGCCWLNTTHSVCRRCSWNLICLPFSISPYHSVLYMISYDVTIATLMWWWLYGGRFVRFPLNNIYACLIDILLYNHTQLII